MKTIAEQWLEFSTLVLPDNVADVQRTEMRRAFYAGFSACLFSLRDLSERDLSEPDSIAEMNGYMSEALEFADRLEAGRP
ncbi:MAG: hypothetical protein AAB721_02910 [Patescibacteria group bacterium]